jgi:hypothetical protein
MVLYPCREAYIPFGFGSNIGLFWFKFQAYDVVQKGWWASLCCNDCSNIMVLTYVKYCSKLFIANDAIGRCTPRVLGLLLTVLGVICLLSAVAVPRAVISVFNQLLLDSISNVKYYNLFGALYRHPTI